MSIKFSACSINTNTVRNMQGEFVPVYQGKLYAVRTDVRFEGFATVEHYKDCVPMFWHSDKLGAEVAVYNTGICVQMPVESEYSKLPNVFWTFYTGKDTSSSHLMQVAERIASYLEDRSQKPLECMDTRVIWGKVKAMLAA